MFRKSSIYNISSSDFNIKPIHQIEIHPAMSTDLSNTYEGENPQGLNRTIQSGKKMFDESNTNSCESLKEIDNLPKRTKQQECFGNILDDEASFKKVKGKKSMTTVRESDMKKDSQKQNCY